MKLILDYLGKSNPDDLLELGCFDAIRVDTLSVLKSGKSLKSTLRSLDGFDDIQVFVDILSTSVDQITSEAKSITKISSAFCLNILATKEGLLACKNLSKDSVLVNIVGCSSISSAFLAYKFGASYVTIDSSFAKQNSSLGKDVKISFNNYPECQTEVLLGNVNSDSDVLYAFSNQFDGCIIDGDAIIDFLKNENNLKTAESVFKEYQNLAKENLYS